MAALLNMTEPSQPAAPPAALAAPQKQHIIAASGLQQDKPAGGPQQSDPTKAQLRDIQLAANGLAWGHDSAAGMASVRPDKAFEGAADAACCALL